MTHPDISPNTLSQSLETTRSGAAQAVMYGLGGVALLAAAGYAETLSSRRWRERQLDFRLVSEPGDLADEMWMVLPGLGRQSADDIAKAVQPSLESNGARVSSMQFPDETPDLDAIAEGINGFVAEQVREIDGERRLNFYCHSMGGLLLARLRNKLDSGIVVPNTILDCTPSGLGSVRGRHGLLKLVARSKYNGGAATKAVLTTLGNRFNVHGDRCGWIDSLIKGYQALETTSHSPKLWAWQIRLLVGTTEDDLASLGNSRVGYLCPIEPLGDRTVDTERSFRVFSGIIPNLSRIAMEGTTHASPTKFPEIHQQKIKEWLASPQPIAA